jgi:hypothetical protein
VVLINTKRVYIEGEITQHSYRTARATDIFMSVERDARTDELENELAKAAGVNLDNHVVYAITSPTGCNTRIIFEGIEVRSKDSALYAWFHDIKLYFGHTIEVGNW